MKKLLGEVCDNLSSENVNDLCQFFVGICESINYQNYHKIKSAEELFSRLQESHLLGLGDLQLLQCILRLLGRLDLAALVEAFVSGTWRSACNLPGIPTPEEESNQDGDKGECYSSWRSKQSYTRVIKIKIPMYYMYATSRTKVPG